MKLNLSKMKETELRKAELKIRKQAEEKRRTNDDFINWFCNSNNS